MYFPDISPYSYLYRDNNAFNIGWLDNTHSYLQGDVPEQFIERLYAFLKIRLNDNILGGHLCELCSEQTWSGEIRVFGQDKIVYAAPTRVEPSHPHSRACAAICFQ